MEARGFAELPDELMRGLLDSAPDAMVIVDTNGLIILVNRQTERLFGYERDELLGEPVEVLVPETLRDRHVTHRSVYMDEPRVRPMGADIALRGRRKDGSDFPVEISLSPLTTPSGALVSAAIRDVTDRTKADKAVRDALRREREAAQHLRELDALKDEFLSTVTHEMRTPLTAIVGFVEIIQEHWSQDQSGDVKTVLQRVAINAQEMSEMIEQLLDFSQVQAGQVTLDREAIDLTEEVAQAVERLRPALDGHHLDIDIPSGTLIRGDHTAMGHILRNLLTNAAKYSDTDTTITVTARPHPESAVAVVEVRDDGIGIPDDERDQIFERFVRGTNAKGRHRGSGVGLSTTQRYVELQGGEITVESEEGRGSTFSFTIPLAGPD